MTNEIEFDTLVIAKIERRSAGGLWVSGSVAEFNFQALVIDCGFVNPAYEVAPASRIVKLWIRKRDQAAAIYEWDRGPSTPTEDARVVRVVNFLAAGLADSASFLHAD